MELQAGGAQARWWRGWWSALALLGLCLLALSEGTDLAADPSLATPRAVVRGRDRGIPFASLRGVAIDSRRGEIYVADAGRNEIVAFDTAGRVRGWFVHRVPDASGAMVDGRPVWIAVDRNGLLLISDERAPWVDVVDFRGRSLAHLEIPAGSDPAEAGAGPIAVGPDGSIFVASRGDSGRVHRFGSDHRYQASWGAAGSDSGQIGGITGITVATDGRVYLTCALTRLAVQCFDADGTFRGGFGQHELGNGTFSMPWGVAATADGRLWVLDQVRHMIQVFTNTGGYVGMCGGKGTAPGALHFPSALAGDGGGLLVVAERVGNRVQVWRTR